MEKVTKEELKKIAKTLQFEIEENEYEKVIEDFEVTIKQMEVLDKIEGLDEKIPMTFPFIEESIGLREDEPSEVLAKEDVLKNAYDTCDNQIRVKKVI